MHFNLKNKKASLSLSVNAIVVLILAITMLGLGLGFMKGMFGKVAQKVDTAIGSTELMVTPTASDPFVISSRQMTLKRGTTEMIHAGYFNEHTSNQSILLNVTCKPGNNITLRYHGDPTNNNTRKVAPAKTIGWDVLIGTTGAQSDDYVCLAAVNSTKKRYADFFITIP